jgi:hypothetical protein
MATASLRPDDSVRIVGEFEVGRIICVAHGYAVVDFSCGDKIKKGYLPLIALESAQPVVFDARKDRHQAR